MMAWRIGGLAVGLIVGIVAAAQGWVVAPVWLWILAAGGAAATATGYVAERRWQPWPKTVIAAAALACSLPLGFLRTVDVVGPPTEGSLRQVLATVEPGTRLAIQGYIESEPESRGPGELDLEVRVRQIRVGEGEDAEWQRVRRGSVLVRAFARASNTEETHRAFNALAAPSAYGWQISFEAPYRPIDAPLNPGTFDYARFLTESGMDTRFRIHVSSVEVMERSRGNWMVEVALMAKTSFIDTFRSRVRSPASRLTAAATLGARRSVEDIDFRGRDLATTLRHAGVGHVLAVSGLHVSVIAVMLFALFRMTGAKPKQFVPFLILFLIMFALLTGARPSSVRAVIMNSVVLIAIAYLRSDIRSATVIGLSLSSFFILIRNPTVLFAPSFLLSYGAVLSLIVIAPPLDRLICSLRGFSLVFAFGWFVLLLRLAGWHLPWLIEPGNLIAYIGLLWLLISIGTRLNHRMPSMWRINLERIPTLIRLFFAAQLAIQLGMMIPLSAWFFGQFPVAGVLVNLIAIPLVGVLVQLGMLTGLVGMIPFVGTWLAIPFGAATTLVGDGFIWMAHIGASVFPYPVTPTPTSFWMGAYYLSLAAFLFLEGNRKWILGGVFRLVPPSPAGTVRRYVVVIPVLMVLIPLLPRPASEPVLREIRILAVDRYPIVLMQSDQDPVLINAGTQFTGGRLVFDSLRGLGATRVDTLFLPAPDPRAGTAGAAELVERVAVRRVLKSIVPEPDQTLPEALGDTYLLRELGRGRPWAVNYERSFEALRHRLREHDIPLLPLAEAELPVWQNGSMALLPLPEEPPTMYSSSASSRILHATLNGLEWIIITDTTPEALFDALANVTEVDILVVPAVDAMRPDGRWLRTAVRRTNPQVLFVAGDRPGDAASIERWLDDPEAVTIIDLAHEGAALIRLRSGQETQISTYRGETRLTVKPR